MFAEMPESDRAMAEHIHAIVTASAPELAPKSWYGMPAYASEGKVICFFQSAAKFDRRYAIFGFQHDAHLDDGGWIFSGTTVLARVDADLEQSIADSTAVPDEFVPDGYEHIGDIDVQDGVLYVPLEQPDYQRDEQIMACFDPETLTMQGSQTVAQRHNSFIAVEGDRAYSMKGFSGDQILVYELGEGCTFEPLEPIQMSVRLDKVQGADVAAGALWLATDDPERAMFRVDLETGVVSRIGAMSNVAPEGEGEGIDATSTDQGLLHVVNIVDTLDVRFEHFEVTEGADQRPVTSSGG